MSTSLSRPRIFYPNQLNRYHECPERYFHERIKKRRGEPTFGTPLARGIAIHDVLRDVAVHYQQHGTAPENLEERMRFALPRSEYLSDENWEEDLETAAKEVEFGSSIFDGQNKVLSTEETYDYHYKRGQDCPPFILAAKVDLVMLCQDGEGKSFLDVIDFKSGAGRIDTIQEVACRIVVKHHGESFRVPFEYIRNTTILTGQETIRSVTLDGLDFRRGWQLISQIVNGIVEAKDWRPIRSPLCEWCPFFDNICSIAPKADGADELGDWLDGAEN
jgi:hypothetical protein